VPSNHDRRGSENGDFAHFDAEVSPLLNPLSRGEGPSRSERRLGLPLVATLGFEMGILGEKPQDLKGAFLKGISSAKNHRAGRSPDESNTIVLAGFDRPVHF
jgi:hypothetical protein